MRRRLLTTAGFLLVVLGYLVSEAILRHRIYGLQRTQSAAEYAELTDRLPSFLRSYFERRRERQELEAKLAAAETSAARAELRHKLCEFVSEAEQHKLMRRTVEELPDSPQAVRAWQFLLPTMSPEEVFAEYLPYVKRCEIRTREQKVHIWRAGLTALRDAPQAMRERYLRQMLAAHVVGAGLSATYESLALQAAVAGDKATAARAKELQAACRQLRQQQQQQRKRGR